MTYRFHLSEQIDENTLVRAMNKCRKMYGGRGAYFGLLAFELTKVILTGAGSFVLAFVILRAFGALPNTQGLYAPIMGSLFAAAVLLLAPRFSQRLQVRQMLSSPLYSGGTDFTLSPESLDMRSPNVVWNVSWKAIERVVNDRNGIFFYAGAFVYVLPKKLLNSEEAKELLESVESWRSMESAD